MRKLGWQALTRHPALKRLKRRSQQTISPDEVLNIRKTWLL
jgi:hypothetical protein